MNKIDIKKIRRIVNESINQFINEDEEQPRYDWSTACYVYVSIEGGRFKGFDLENGEQVDKLIYCSTMQNNEQSQNDLQNFANEYAHLQLKVQLRRPQDGKVVFQTH